MESGRLLLDSLAELRRIVGAPNEYGVLRSAAVLRLLLLDSPRLVDEVNREKRLRIVFRVVTMDNYIQMLLDDGALFYSTEDGLDPDTAPFGVVAELNRDQFLKHRVMVVQGHVVTVHDLIDQLAHIEGGVHVGTPKTTKQAALSDAARLFGIGGLPAGIRMMAAVCRVVLRGLEPLENEVRQG